MNLIGHEKHFFEYIRKQAERFETGGGGGGGSSSTQPYAFL